MKKLLCLLLALLVLGALPAFAAETPALRVEIVSPAAIEAAPVHNDTIVIRITNDSDRTFENLHCYLTVLDVGRTQTLPVDEFGSSAYYSQIIDRLAPGEHAEITIPVRILYVGNFRFTATVADVSSNELFTGPAITVHMQAVSSISHPLVIATAAAVPLLLAALAFVLTRRRK